MTNKRDIEKEDFKDDFIKDFVEKGSRTILNEDFENQVMQHVYYAAKHKKEVNSKMKRSMYFFYFGILLIGIYTLVTILGELTLNNSTHLVSILTLFFAIVFGIIMINNFRRFLSMKY